AWPEIERGERLLPWGPWREPWSQVQGATALLLQEAPAQMELPWPWRSLPALHVAYRPRRLLAWKAGKLGAGPALSLLRGMKVLALSGLGNPGRFEASLSGLGAQLKLARFPDHHPYRAGELRGLDLDVKAIVTTVKD